MTTGPDPGTSAAVRRDLEAARAALASFEGRVTPQRRIERLVAHRPRHPWLMMWRGLGAGAALCGALAVAFLVSVQVSPQLALRLGMLGDATGLSAPLVMSLLGLVLLALSLGARRMAIEWGARHSPPLPDELRQHQQLLAEVQRLTSLVGVDRRTPVSTSRRPDYWVPTEPWKPRSR